jgi:oligopeptide transport system substrate-binding protein
MRFLLAILLALSCTKREDRSDLLELSLPSDVTTMDPANCYDAVCFIPVSQIYESLYEFDYLKRPYSVRPLLAEKLPLLSSDRLTYTIKLKRGIKYHPTSALPTGREVKADDFVNQIKRLAFQGSVSQGWWILDGKIKGINDWRSRVGTDLELFFQLEIPGVRALDEHTLEIKLVHPYPQLIYGMAMPFFSPVPREIILATKNDLSRTFVGTGPYIVKNFNPSQQIDLIKNENYVSSTYPSEGDRFAHQNGLLKDAGARLPFVKSVRLKVMEETQTEWLNFMAKKIDLINLTKDQYPQALTESGEIRPEIIEQKINLQTSPTLIYWWIAFNMKDPIVGSNLNLRKAIAHGVNIDKFIELFTYNVAQKANSIYPPGVPGYSPSAELPYRYDRELAKEYLKKAGYPQGKGLPTLVFDIRGTDTRRRQMGEYIQQELRKIGINVDVRVNTFPAFLEKSRKGELQFWQGNWVMDYPDAENVLQTLSSANLPPGSNYSQYSNSEFDRLFEELRALEDGPKKTELMRRMENLVNRDLPWAMQYYSRNYILYHNYLKNFRYSDIIYNNLKYLKLSGKE